MQNQPITIRKIKKQLCTSYPEIKQQLGASSEMN